MGNESNSVSTGRGGLSVVSLVGAVMAAFCSWQLNHSIFWAGIHAVFGWLYLLYLCFGCGGGFPTGFW